MFKLAWAVTVAAMRAANIFAVSSLAAWAGLLWMGIGLIQGVLARHVPGYPNADQIQFFIYMPAFFFTLLLLAFVFLIL